MAGKSIAGRQRFEARTKALSGQLQGSVKPAMAAGATRIVSLMQSMAPENRWPGQSKPWQQPGTLKRAINWIWTGASRITIRAKPPEMPNLGLWTEKGTVGHAPGSYRDRLGKKRNAGSRGHTATKAQPFFMPAWRLSQRWLFGGIRDAAKEGLKK